MLKMLERIVHTWHDECIFSETRSVVSPPTASLKLLSVRNAQVAKAEPRSQLRGPCRTFCAVLAGWGEDLKMQHPTTASGNHWQPSRWARTEKSSSKSTTAFLSLGMGEVPWTTDTARVTLGCLFSKGICGCGESDPRYW